MKGNKIRETSVYFEGFIGALYGIEGYNEIKHHNTFSQSKKYYKKIIKSLELTANSVLTVTDKVQRQEIERILNFGKHVVSKAKDFNTLDQEFIIFLSKLSFQLLGHFPNRIRQKRVTNRKENWKLNHVRQLQYVQDKKQKEIMIFGVIQDRFYINSIMIGVTSCLSTTQSVQMMLKS